METLYVISIGVVNITTGKTMHGWSIYENHEKQSEYKAYVSLTQNGSLLYGSGPLEIGKKLELRGNDSKRLLGSDTVIDSSESNMEDVLVMLKRNNYDYYPIKAFKARAKNNLKLKTSYSIK